MTITRIWALVALTAAAMTLVGAAPAAAEFQLDVYGGGALTQNVDFSLSGLGGSNSTGGMSVNHTFAFGGRIGYWFGALPWLGLAVDGFQFGPEIPSQQISGSFGNTGAPPGSGAQKLNLTIQAVSFEIKARAPLMKSGAFPDGRLQPYILAGPAIFFAELDDSNNFIPNNQSNSDTEVGVKAGAGIAFQIIPQIAVFTEYRYTHFSPSWTFTNSAGSPSSSFGISTTINSHQIVGGLSFRFP